MEIIYDNDWVLGVEYEKHKRGLQWKISGRRSLYRCKNYENEDQDKYLEAEENIDKDELEYLEEDTTFNY